MRSRSVRAFERSSSIEETEARNEVLRKRKAALEAELESWNAECRKLEAERESLSVEISDLESDCEMYEEGIAAYESDLRDLNAV